MLVAIAIRLFDPSSTFNFSFIKRQKRSDGSIRTSLEYIILVRSFCLDAERTKEIKASEKFAETSGGLELKV